MIRCNPPGMRNERAALAGRESREPVEANSGGGLREAFDGFLELEALTADRDRDGAVRGQPQMVSRFYDVVTRFHDYGWGQSFHFTPRRSGEGLRAAQRRRKAGVADLGNASAWAS